MRRLTNLVLALFHPRYHRRRELCVATYACVHMPVKQTDSHGHIDISLHARCDIMRKGEWMMIENEQKKYGSTWHTRALASWKQFDGRCRLHSLHWGMSTQRWQRPPFVIARPQFRQRGCSAAAAIIIYKVVNVILFHWNKTTLNIVVNSTKNDGC